MITGRYNYYDILEVKKNSPQHEVTRAYERMRATYSAENSAIYTIFTENEARELLSFVEEAYSVLGNKTLRGLYDQRVAAGQYSPQDLNYESLVRASKQSMMIAPPTTARPKFERNAEQEKAFAALEAWTGEDLKRCREYQKLSIDDMHAITKINPFYIRAIETMEPQNLPAIVFVRGYVVQIARALNLNDRHVADSYMANFKKAK